MYTKFVFFFTEGRLQIFLNINPALKGLAKVDVSFSK